MRVLIFFGCLLAVVAYATWKGGRPEKIGAWTAAAGACLTLATLAPAVHRFASIEAGVLVVDGWLLGVFLWLALRTDRYWPLWAAAFQILGTLSHVTKLLDLEMPRNGYAFLQAFWSYPILLSIALGTLRCQRARRGASAAAT